MSMKKKQKAILKFSKLIDKNLKNGIFDTPEQEEQVVRHIQLQIQRLYERKKA